MNETCSCSRPPGWGGRACGQRCLENLWAPCMGQTKLPALVAATAHVHTCTSVTLSFAVTTRVCGVLWHFVTRSYMVCRASVTHTRFQRNCLGSGALSTASSKVTFNKKGRSQKLSFLFGGAVVPPLAVILLSEVSVARGQLWSKILNGKFQKEMICNF